MATVRYLMLLCIGAGVLCAQPGSVEGRVVNQVSGDPLRKTTLTLTRVGGGEPLTAASGENGQFAFKAVEPGDYRLSAERTGYLRQNFGARRQQSPGAIIRVPAGQSVKDLVFRLAPSAVISGRVIDDAGEPLPNLMVGVYRSAMIVDKRRWQQAGQTQTNDRGEYRISGLRAGRYVVASADLNVGIGIAGISTDALPDKPEAAYAPTYYGGSTDISRARPIELAAGEDRRGTDIQMAKTPTVRVRGRVATIPDAVQVVVALVRKSGAEQVERPGGVAVVQAEGKFEIRNVIPGQYLLIAQSIPGGGVAGVMPLEVADRHIDGVQMPVGNSGDVAGKVSPAVPASKTGAPRVMASYVDYSLPNAPSAMLGEDGTFTLKNVFPGAYRLWLDNLPDDAYVKSIRVGGKAVSPDRLDLAPDSGALEIQLGRDGGEVEGVVKGPGDQPVPNATVALIPASGESLWYRDATSGFDGTFRVRGVPPGKYSMLAWEDIEPNAYRDREFTKQFEKAARAVALKPSERLKLDIVAVPIEATATERKE